MTEKAADTTLGSETLQVKIIEDLAYLKARVDGMAEDIRDIQSETKNAWVEIRGYGVKLSDVTSSLASVRDALAEMKPAVRKVNGIDEALREVKPMVARHEAIVGEAMGAGRAAAWVGRLVWTVGAALLALGSAVVGLIVGHKTP